MAAANKEIDEQLKQMLWSPNSENMNSNNDSKQQQSKRNLGGKKKAQKHCDEGTSQKYSSSPNFSVNDKSVKSVKNFAPTKILQREDSKNTDNNSVNEPSPKVRTSNSKFRGPKSAKQNKTLPSSITFGPKEDIGQPVDRGSKGQRASSSQSSKGEGKPETDGTERKKPKKKTPKKSKNKTKEDTEQSPVPDSNKTIKREETAGALKPYKLFKFLF